MIKLIALLFLSTGLFSNTIIKDDAKNAFKHEYSIAGNNKVFAQSAGGVWAWSAGKTTIESARQDAMDVCNRHLFKDDKPCIIINENGKWK